MQALEVDHDHENEDHEAKLKGERGTLDKAATKRSYRPAMKPPEKPNDGGGRERASFASMDEILARILDVQIMLRNSRINLPHRHRMKMRNRRTPSIPNSPSNGTIIGEPVSAGRRPKTQD